ncbi:uncharacterized protein LOC115091905 isoform X2 [Rhinatrema bivittatum]|uniref:uncharacterized protein LOC115091905 isoform X2 n=1 Tax=Rhinatrema bivittatum TaxID=194408 RepID=UPI00112EBA7B|nr:uncharacterized protein LOC115091905 isoform X2 [Rhinatrema bivittatum]
MTTGGGSGHPAWPIGPFQNRGPRQQRGEISGLHALASSLLASAVPAPRCLCRESGRLPETRSRHRREWDAGSCTPLEHWSRDALDLLRQSITPSTWRAYLRGYNEVLDFPEASDQSEDLSLSHRMVEYIVRAKQRGVSRGTIQTNLAGYAFFAKAQGLPNPVRDFAVRRVLMVRANYNPQVPDVHRPILHDHLLALWRFLPSVVLDHFELALFRAAFCIAFCARCRVSELVAAAKSKHDRSGLRACDVSIANGKLTVQIRRSKTNQLSRGTSVTLTEVPGLVTCPVANAARYEALRPGGGGGDTVSFACQLNPSEQVSI